MYQFLNITQRFVSFEVLTEGLRGRVVLIADHEPNTNAMVSLPISTCRFQDAYSRPECRLSVEIFDHAFLPNNSSNTDCLPFANT
jgi:hypothetical protein